MEHWSISNEIYLQHAHIFCIHAHAHVFFLHIYIFVSFHWCNTHFLPFIKIYDPLILIFLIINTPDVHPYLLLQNFTRSNYRHWLEMPGNQEWSNWSSVSHHAVGWQLPIGYAVLSLSGILIWTLRRTSMDVLTQTRSSWSCVLDRCLSSLAICKLDMSWTLAWSSKLLRHWRFRAILCWYCAHTVSNLRFIWMIIIFGHLKIQIQLHAQQEIL